MQEAYIVEAVRTPIGKKAGSLSLTRPDDLGGFILAEALRRSGVPAKDIEDVIMGCVTQIDEQGGNIARMAVLAGGLPVSIPGTSVNRMCASGLQAVHFAAQGIMSGTHDLLLAAGVESMSRVPMASDLGSFSEKMQERFKLVTQGTSAELIAERWGLTRQRLDEFSLESHRRAIRAIEEGYGKREIAPVEVKLPDGSMGLFSQDEGPRRETSLEKLANLKPAFKEDGVITAGSSSQISDGAAALLMASPQKAKELGLKPRARIRAMASIGVDPTMMLTGPIPATQMVLKKAGMTLGDIDLVEINEAFASVVLAWAQELNADLNKVNVNGGAIALGHPLGASGARLVVSALHELERRDLQTGLITLCIGFGHAVATVIERV